MFLPEIQRAVLSCCYAAWVGYWHSFVLYYYMGLENNIEICKRWNCHGQICTKKKVTLTVANLLAKYH